MTPRMNNCLSRVTPQRNVAPFLAMALGICLMVPVTAFAQITQPSIPSPLPGPSLVSMDLASFTSLIASLVSMILGVIAIWLSVVFYRMSNTSAKESNEAAKAISASVERLETVFDKLYADTFSMMKDTYSDMRKHIWHKDPMAEAIRETDQLSTKDIKEKTSDEITALIREKSQLSKEELKKQIALVVAEAIAKTQQNISQPRSDSIAKHIIDLIFRREITNRHTTLQNLVELLRYTEQEIVDELFKLRRVNKLTWEGSSNRLGMDDKIALVRAGDAKDLDSPQNPPSSSSP